MKNTTLLFNMKLLLIFLCIILYGCQDCEKSYVVVKVYDADTYTLNDGSKIRLADAMRQS